MGVLFLKRYGTIITIYVLIIFFGAVQAGVEILATRGMDNKSKEVLKETEFSIFIEVEDKTLYLLQNGKCVKRYPIASGRSDLPSPLGGWRIVSKGDWGEGFGGRWMGLNVPWGTYGIHGTTIDGSIGHAASHGCIRMYNDDIKELYSKVTVGTAVVIANGSFGPFGTGFKAIGPGDRGADVQAVQRRLAEMGYFTGQPSGIYGDDLKAAVYSFQKKNGLTVKYTITEKDWSKMGFKKFE